MTELLEVGVSSWIIADGNYSHFSVGDVRSFALEYFHEGQLGPSTAPASHRHLGDARHAVIGRRVHLAPTWCAVDIGVLAYRLLNSFPPPPPSFSGELYLNVDSFFYFETLAHDTDAPPLIYDWRIHRIEVETAPRILEDGLMIYDPDKRKRVGVQDTKAGEDFILHCERLQVAPQQRRTHV